MVRVEWINCPNCYAEMGSRDKICRGCGICRLCGGKPSNHKDSCQVYGAGFKFKESSRQDYLNSIPVQAVDLTGTVSQGFQYSKKPLKAL